MQQRVLGIAACVAAAWSLSAESSRADMFDGLQEQDGQRVYFDGLSDSFEAAAQGSVTELEIGAGYAVELSRVETTAWGNQVWNGFISDENQQHRVFITRSNGLVFGNISTPDGSWVISPSPQGGHVMQRFDAFIDPDLYLDDVAVHPDSIDFTTPPSASESGPETAEAVAVGSNGTVDIAVVYNQTFSDYWALATGGRIQHLVAYFDQILVDSGTGLRARLVHAAPLNFSGTATVSALHDDMYDGIRESRVGDNGHDFSGLPALRDAFGADLVIAIRRSNESQMLCGRANGSGHYDQVINDSDAQMAVGFVQDWFNVDDPYNPGGRPVVACGDITFPHEAGHLLGMGHTRSQDGSSYMPVREYARAYYISGVGGTVMHGGAFPVFSNPDLQICGGQACGVPNSEDGARAIREEGRNVADFRPVAPRVVSSVLPITRTVQNGTTATAFATIINPASTGSEATACGLRLHGAAAGEFSYQTTDAQNAPTGTPNTPVNISAGGSQSFVFSVNRSDWADRTGSSPNNTANNETDLYIEASCSNRRSAEYVLGLNSLTYSASATAVPDIVALAASGDPGRVNVRTDGNRTGAFAVAISNVGAAGTIDVTADTGGRTLAIDAIEVCQTDPGTGACTSARASSVQLAVGASGTATFAVFVRGTGAAIDNDPARNRVFVRFNEGGSPRGATSVAVRTQ